jgi:dihydroorotate dehydrogenase electron transfer subunit
VGAGTKEFSGYKSGDGIDVLGPLGNGFPEEEGTALLIGGGIGLPPMLALAKSRPADKNIIVAGYRNRDMFLLKELSEHGTLHIAMESLKDEAPAESEELLEDRRITEELIQKGIIASCTGGNVLDALRENALKAEVLYACGPTPMLRALKDFSQKERIKAWFSLEQRMACGIGVCLACVCDTKEPDEHSKVKNKRICREGPVFSSEEVIL